MSHQHRSRNEKTNRIAVHGRGLVARGRSRATATQRTSPRAESRDSADQRGPAQRSAQSAERAEQSAEQRAERGGAEQSAKRRAARREGGAARREGGAARRDSESEKKTIRGLTDFSVLRVPIADCCRTNAYAPAVDTCRAISHKSIPGKRNGAKAALRATERVENRGC
jgi:hypothetical protein